MGLFGNILTAVRRVKEQYEAAHPPLHDAALDGDQRRVERLLGAGADVSARSAGGWTTLHWAVQGGSVGVVALVLEGGARPDARDDKGQTPLHHAAAGGSIPLATLLLDAGADINAQDNEGRTPLALALDPRGETGRKLLLLPSRGRVAELLRERGARE
jgi:ankyrin repeat protein